jgi:hypothetical protein
MTCRAPCCSVAPRRTVSDLFERGFRRSRAAPCAIEGDGCTDHDGHAARFSLDVAGGMLAAVGFRCTPCATLVAYCELIAESAPGFRLDIAGALTAPDLIDMLPGVPALKRGRAVLAVAAFRAALLAAESPSDVNPGEAR